jgi:hypothetical protein
MSAGHADLAWRSKMSLRVSVIPGAFQGRSGAVLGPFRASF